MKDAFIQGEDIHARTAAEINGVPQDKVTPDMRRNAKAINFGIAYGMTKYGLSKSLNIPVIEADNYIRRYFTRYPGIQKYIAETKEQLVKNCYVENIFGRRRYFPNVTRLKRQDRERFEREAINTPIQGTAADLIKIAMNEIFVEIKKQALKSRMIIQVHDELVFEVANDELDGFRKLVTEKMEKAYDFSLPIKVDVGTGKNWAEAH